jgi:hypothetical protein
MFIKIQTELGSNRIINTNDVDYVEEVKKNTCSLLLKTHPDFPIRIKLSLNDMLDVLNGVVKFDEVFKEVVEVINGVAGIAKQDNSNSLQEAGLLKAGVSSPEELEEVRKEFSQGLVSGSMGKATSVKEEVISSIPAEIPTFSKKLMKKREESVKKDSVW